jgi:hypothetical protein
MKIARANEMVKDLAEKYRQALGALFALLYGERLKDSYRR